MLFFIKKKNLIVSIICLEVINLLKVLKKYYPIGIALLLLIVFIALSLGGDEDNMVFNPVVNNEETDEVEFIYVDIKGQVMNPGVYKVEKHSRLFQVIGLAGGITEDADILAYNLSMRLRDEQVIYIPSFNDEYPMITVIIENDQNGIININTATLQQLDTLPGIGPTTAQSIIDYREENGEFSTVDDLIEVPGIGEATLNEIREFIIT